MKQFKALKIRLYPNKEQKTLIDKTLGAARALYNMMLYERIHEITDENIEQLLKSPHTYKTEIEYTKEFEWFKEVDTTALIQSRKNLELAYSIFIKTLKTAKIKSEVALPKFKRKKVENSYKTTFSHNNITIDYNNKVVRLPKIGFVLFRDKRGKGFGEIISATVSRTSSEKYFVSLLFSSVKVQTYKKTVTDPEKVIGLDMSFPHFYVDNKGATPQYVKNTKKYEKRLTNAQRRFSKKQYQSNAWYKERKKVAIIHEKIANSRAYFNQHLIHYLVTTYDAICIEKLNLKKIISGIKAGKSVNDVRYGEFIEKLKQKGQEYGTHIIQVSTYFPSSKQCSTCGYKNNALELHQREWVCPNCNTLHNRDINAGKNLRNEGLKYLGLL